jgi:hypothetical protein
MLTIATGLVLCTSTVQSDETLAQTSDAAKKQFKVLIDEFEEDGEARESASRFIELAEEHPKSTYAVDALVWVVTNVSRGRDLERATTLLAKNHVKSERLVSVCRELPQRFSRASENLLRELRAKNPHIDVRAQASFHLAIYLQQQLLLLEAINKGPKADRQQFEQFYGKDYIQHLDGLNSSESLKEVELIYEDVAWKFANVRVDDSTMGRTVRRELYSIRNLSLGRTVPEITGRDVDGKAFKLSDYRDKVVLLDFWGHW